MKGCSSGFLPDSCNRNAGISCCSEKKTRIPIGVSPHGVVQSGVVMVMSSPVRSYGVSPIGVSPDGAREDPINQNPHSNVNLWIFKCFLKLLASEEE